MPANYRCKLTLLAPCFGNREFRCWANRWLLDQCCEILLCIGWIFRALLALYNLSIRLPNFKSFAANKWNTQKPDEPNSHFGWMKVWVADASKHWYRKTVILHSISSNLLGSWSEALSLFLLSGYWHPIMLFINFSFGGPVRIIAKRDHPPCKSVTHLKFL